MRLGASTLGWASTTTPYKLSAQYLYPLVQTMADPALEKVWYVRNGTRFVNCAESVYGCAVEILLLVESDA